MATDEAFSLGALLNFQVLYPPSPSVPHSDSIKNTAVPPVPIRTLPYHYKIPVPEHIRQTQNPYLSVGTAFTSAPKITSGCLLTGVPSFPIRNFCQFQRMSFTRIIGW